MSDTALQTFRSTATFQDDVATGEKIITRASDHLVRLFVDYRTMDVATSKMVEELQEGGDYNEEQAAFLTRVALQNVREMVGI